MGKTILRFMVFMVSVEVIIISVGGFSLCVTDEIYSASAVYDSITIPILV